MTIFRVQHNKDYTVVNNFICKDNRLSWKAKGIWLYAFSCKDDWTFFQSEMISHSTDGRESFRSGLKELINFGYLVRNQIRNLKGQISYEWVFYETPQQLKEKVPETGNPSTVKAATEDRPLTSTDEINTDKSNTYSSLYNYNNNKQNNKQQPAAVVVVDADEKISLMDSLGLSKQVIDKFINHPLEDIRQAIIVCGGYDKPSNINGLFTKAITEKWQPKEKILSYEEQIIKYFKHGLNYLGAECYLDNEGISFNRGNMMYEGIKFKEFNFKDKFNCIMSKFSIDFQVQ